MEIYFNALLSVEHYQGIESGEPSMKPQFIDRQTLLQAIRNMRSQTKARDSGTGDRRNKIDSEWRFIGLKKGFSSFPLDGLSKGAPREFIRITNPDKYSTQSLYPTWKRPNAMKSAHLHKFNLVFVN